MTSRRLKILVVFEIPRKPKLPLEEYLKLEDWEDERDVVKTLKSLGHEIMLVGLDEFITPLIAGIKEFKPDLVFNLCEALDKNRNQEPNIAGVCELYKVPYTGASPFALHLCQDKAIQKKILSFTQIKTPRFLVIPNNQKNYNLQDLTFPLIIKPLNLEASEGISHKSFTQTPSAAKQRILYLQKKYKADVIVEEFIEGTDLYTAVMGDHSLTVGHPLELKFTRYPIGKRKIATYKTKWDEAYRKKWGIRSLPIKPPELIDKVKKICKKIYSELKISGYARFDMRITPEGNVFFIEANPNPSIAKEDDFSKSAMATGLSYKQILEKIVHSSLR